MPATLTATPLGLSAMANGNGASTPAAALAAIAQAGDLGLAPAELRQATGLPERSLRWAVGQLQRAGLISRQGERGRLFATPAGVAEAGATPALTVSGPSAAALDQALARLPAEGLRALTRLVLSTVVARHHLRHERPSGWLSAIACGPTKTGKTLAGAIVCQVFGLDEAVHVRLVEAETERSLWGRREQVPGGGWVLRAAPALSYPFVVLDELDKASGELRTAVLKLMQGEAHVAGEGDQVVEVAPVVLATSNGATSSLRPEYRRRAVVLDTTALVPLLRDIDLAAGRILTPGTLPHLSLDKLRPPASALPGTELLDMRKALRSLLTDEGWRHVELRGLELAALGRAAIWGCSTDIATTATALDYCACAVTVAEAEAGRLARARQALADSGVLDGSAAETFEAEQRALDDNRRQAHLAADREALELIGARAAMAARLEDTSRLLGRLRPSDPEHAIAKGLSHQLSALRQDVQASRSRERLEELAPICEEHLRKAQALVAEREERQRWAAVARTPRRPALAPAPYLPPAGGPLLRRLDEAVPFTPNLMTADGRLSREALLPVAEVPVAKVETY